MTLVDRSDAYEPRSLHLNCESGNTLYTLRPRGSSAMGASSRMVTVATATGFSQLDTDWQAGTIGWKPLCRSGSNWDSQDSHPHPIFDNAAQFIYFSSNFEGRRAIYRVRAIF